MSKRQFNEEFRVQVVKDVLETGETGLVARHYSLHPVLGSRWVNNFKKYGKTTVSKPKEPKSDSNLSALANENEKLKKLLGEKELEIQILRDLFKKTNQL